MRFGILLLCSGCIMEFEVGTNQRPYVPGATPLTVGQTPDGDADCEVTDVPNHDLPSLHIDDEFPVDWQVDTLLVVDTTWDGSSVRTSVANSISRLVEPLLGRDVRFGVVPMFATGESLGALVELNGLSWVEGAEGKQEIVAWLSNAVLDAGTYQQGGVGGLDALESALTERVSDSNAGFQRPGAFLQVILVGSDQGYGEPPSQLDVLSALVRSPGTARRVSVSAITALGEDDPACTMLTRRPEAEHFTSIVQATEGRLSSHCAPDVGSFLDGLGQDIAYRGLIDQFSLLGPADPSTLEVRKVDTVGNSVLTTAYGLSDGNTSLVLHRPLPPEGTRIEVSYAISP